MSVSKSLCITVCLCFPLIAAAQKTYRIFPFRYYDPALGYANQTTAYGINDRGEIVGSYTYYPIPNVDRAFYRGAKGYLPDKKADYRGRLPEGVTGSLQEMYARSINYSGVIVGTAYTERGRFPYRLMDINQTPEILPVPSGVALNVSNSGTVLFDSGVLLTSAGTFKQIQCPEGFFSTNLMGRNDKGDVVGSDPDGAGVLRSAKGECEEFRFSEHYGTLPWSINNSGQIAGYFVVENHPGFIRQSSGEFTLLNFPGFEEVEAYSITNGGLVAGVVAHRDRALGTQGFYAAPIGSADLDVSDDLLPFVPEPVNTFSSHYEHVEVRNRSTERMVLGELSQSSGQSAIQLKLTTSCGVILGAGQSCGIDVWAAPLAHGRQLATLKFASTAANSPNEITIETNGN